MQWAVTIEECLFAGRARATQAPGAEGVNGTNRSPRVSEGPMPPGWQAGSNPRVAHLPFPSVPPLAPAFNP